MGILSQRYLVIGANSFLAKEIILRLYKNNTVVGVYHQNTNNLISKVKNIKIEELRLLDDDFDVVYYISANIPEKGELESNSLLKKVNVELPKMVCEKFKKARIIYASSVSVYTNNSNIFNEHSFLAPDSLYGKSKVEGESIISEHSNYGIIRISSMYGIGMKETTFIPQIINDAIRNKKIKLLGLGQRIQNYIHVSDVAEIFIRAATDNSNSIYLAVSEKSYSNLDLAVQITKELTNVDIEFIGEDNSKSFQYDGGYTYTSLNYKPEKCINNEINELIKWQQKKS